MAGANVKQGPYTFAPGLSKPAVTEPNTGRVRARGALTPRALHKIQPAPPYFLDARGVAGTHDDPTRLCHRCRRSAHSRDRHRPVRARRGRAAVHRRRPSPSSSASLSACSTCSGCAPTGLRRCCSAPVSTRWTSSPTPPARRALSRLRQYLHSGCKNVAPRFYPLPDSCQLLTNWAQCRSRSQ